MLSWIGGGLAAICGGLWTLFTFFRKPAAAPTGRGGSRTTTTNGLSGWPLVALVGALAGALVLVVAPERAARHRDGGRCRHWRRQQRHGQRAVIRIGLAPLAIVAGLAAGTAEAQFGDRVTAEGGSVALEGDNTGTITTNIGIT